MRQTPDTAKAKKLQQQQTNKQTTTTTKPQKWTIHRDTNRPCMYNTS